MPLMYLDMERPIGHDPMTYPWKGQVLPTKLRTQCGASTWNQTKN